MKFFGNMKIKGKLLFGFGMVLCLTLFLAIFSYVLIRRVNASYDNILEGPVSRSVAILNIKGNFAIYRRIAAQAVVYSDNPGMLAKLSGEYDTLKEDTNAQVNNYFSSLTADLTLDEDGIKTRTDTLNNLKTLLDTDYNAVVQRIFACANKGDRDGALNELLTGANIATDASTQVDALLASAKEVRIAMSNDASQMAKSAEYLVSIISIVATLLGVIFAIALARIISKGIVEIRTAAKKIAEGDFNVVVGSNNRDEIGDLSNTLLMLKNTIESLVNDIEHVSEEIAAGDIDKRINETAYKGEFHKVAKGINKTLDDQVEDNLSAVDTVVAFGNGNFNIPIRVLPGKKIVMTNSFKSVKENLIKFNADIQSVIKGASAGNLDTRIDTSAYQGDWSMMASSINGLLGEIVKPVREAIEVMNQLASGDLNVSVKGTYQGEFDVMKNALNRTLTMLSSYIIEISTILNALANDNLNQTVKREYVGQFSTLKEALNIIIDKLNQMIASIVMAANQVADGSEQISKSSSVLAQGASEQASSVEQLNATVAIIHENTQKNVKDTEKANALSKDSQVQAVNGNQYMDNLLSAMEMIKESSNGISKIIKSIDDIAFQTNLLALNASVEAARAGEHGRGFTVVAEEVRSLAAKSQESARETAALIEEAINRVNEGTRIANQTANALHTIIGSVKNIAGIVENISKASNEQASAIQQLTEGTVQITSVIQSNSATSEEAAASSEELSSQAELLRHLVSVFQLKKR